METLSLRLSTRRKMLLICSERLIDYVFDDFKDNGGVIIIGDNEKDIWDITKYIFTTTIPLIEKLKVLSTFDDLEWTRIIYENKALNFSALCSILRNKDTNVVTDTRAIQASWVNNSLNDTQPFFDLWSVSIPIVRDKYTITKMSETQYQIAEWVNGGYHEMKDEFYETKGKAQKRIQELLEEESL